MNKAPLYFLALGVLVLLIGGFVYWYTSTTPVANTPTNEPVLIKDAKDESTTISDESQYMKIRATVPTASPLASTAGVEASNKAVALMRGAIEAQIAEFKKQDTSWLKEREGADGYQLEFSTHYTVLENTKLISYVYQVYVWSGGAHGGTNALTYTFDKKTGAQVLLEDLFITDSPYLERISTHTKERLLETLGEYKDEEWITTGTAPKKDNFKSFLIDGDSLTIIFGQYQVGPYVLGMPEIMIPLSTLSDILKPEYR